MEKLVAICYNYKNMIFNEETADFRKPAQITNKDYVQSKKNFDTASNDKKPQMFLNFCFAVIYQKNEGSLSIREAAYAISNCEDSGGGLSSPAQAVIKEALSLRRHPSNYKEDHQLGWNNLVKHIADLRKKI